VDAESITVQALALLARRGEVDPGSAAVAASRYRLDNPAAADAGNTEGGG
jgi:pyruvate dehydrogenase E1 component